MQDEARFSSPDGELVVTKADRRKKTKNRRLTQSGHTITTDQLDVLDLAAKGYGVDEIAEKLGIHSGTVKKRLEAHFDDNPHMVRTTFAAVIEAQKRMWLTPIVRLAVRMVPLRRSKGS